MADKPPQNNIPAAELNQDSGSSSSEDTGSPVAQLVLPQDQQAGEPAPGGAQGAGPAEQGHNHVNNNVGPVGFVVVVGPNGQHIGSTPRYLIPPMAPRKRKNAGGHARFGIPPAKAVRRLDFDSPEDDGQVNRNLFPLLDNPPAQPIPEIGDDQLELPQILDPAADQENVDPQEADHHSDADEH